MLELFAIVALLIGLYGLARAKYLALKAEDLRRIERKLEAITELLATELGAPSGFRSTHQRVIGEGRDLEAAVTRSDLSRVERKLDAIIRALGLEEKLWPTVSATVRHLWAERRKIEAVRAYRTENPQLGLREAKEILEWNLSR